MLTINRAITVLAAILGLQVVAIALGWYNYFPSFDIPMHFAGGFGAAMLVLAIWAVCIDSLTFKRSTPAWLQPIMLACIVLGLVALVGLAWEWFEFGVDTLIIYLSSNWAPTQMGLGDTLLDLALDLLGGLLAFAIWRPRV